MTLKLSALALAAGLLAGCAAPQPIVPQPSKAELAAADAKRLADLPLCNAEHDLSNQLGAMRADATGYNDPWVRREAMKQEIRARGLNCYKIRSDNAAPAKPAKPLSPRQKQARASAVCNATAQRTRFADPGAAYEMCVRRYKASAAKCEANQASFNTQAQGLSGAARAEYIELASSFRAGCNLK